MPLFETWTKTTKQQEIPVCLLMERLRVSDVVNGLTSFSSHSLLNFCAHLLNYLESNETVREELQIILHDSENQQGTINFEKLKDNVNKDIYLKFYN